MGCSALSGDQPSIRVVPINISIQNSYVDQYPRITIQKIKQKFTTYANANKQLTSDKFCLLYACSVQTDKLQPHHHIFLNRLFLFFNDLLSGNIKFKQFMTKYAILNKCNQETLSNIIYFLYSSSYSLDQPMKITSYNQFILIERQSFGFEPSAMIERIIDRKDFYQKLKESGFLWEDYRKRFSLIEKEDMPFETISRQLIDCEILDYKIGEPYYVISSQWYQRWAYYYHGKDHTVESEDIRSTKLIRKKTIGHTDSSYHIKKKQKISFANLLYDDDPNNILLIEKPHEIKFDDIEGEYEDELKENLDANYSCRIINENLWIMLKKVHPSKSEYRRIANSESTLQLYPKTIYFLQTDSSGQIIDRTLEIVQLSLKAKLHSLSENDQVTFFIKEFEQRNWFEGDKDKVLAQCSASPRFFVVETKNKKGFLEENERKQIEIENITYGDKVYSYFPFARRVMPAIVMRIPSKKNVKLHYIKYSFKYQIEVNRETLSFEEEQYLSSSIQLSLQGERQLFKGLANIGNTCFINCIVQSLIATPVLEQYLSENEFNKNKQPILYAISEVSKKLLVNQKGSPSELKKKIDVHLQMFSGYNQHDAQEFLNLLLDRINEEINHKPSIIDELFGGQSQSTFKCHSCGEKRDKAEKFSALSLPIPEPQYNIFTIIVFPIYGARMKKIILRLHKFSNMRQYLSTFEDRMNRSVNEFIFCEAYGGNIKKIRTDFYKETEKQKNVLDKGLSASMEIYAFQKLKKSFFLEIQENHRRNHLNSVFVDYYDTPQKNWYYGKLSKKKDFVEVFTPENGFQTIKINNDEPTNIKPLGQMNRQTSFRKFFFRRYNVALKRMEYFGYQHMIELPRYFSYAQFSAAFDTYLSNYMTSEAKSKAQKPYYIKVIETIKFNCIFCGMGELKFENASQVSRCCTVMDQQTPLLWLSKQKPFQFYVDWLDMGHYNENMSSLMEMDMLSIHAEKQKSNDKIVVYECFDLMIQPQIIEMECSKCQNASHSRVETLKTVPNILVMHMKQFRITAEKILIKLDVNLKWIEYLDISKYCEGENAQLYELYAYVKHMGTNQLGHYTSVTKRKHPFENRKVWVNFDDDKTEILESQKNIDSAYLLFFKKVDMPVSTQINFLNDK